jgi:hypothetical protein
MKRYIYAFDTIDAACSAVVQLRERGVDDRYISLIARQNVQNDRLLDACVDLVPKFGWGAVIGGSVGLWGGIIAMWVLSLGLALGGLMVLWFSVGGAILGAWTSNPIEPSVFDEGPRTLMDEVDAGRTLLVVDSDNDDQALLRSMLGNETADRLIWQSVRHTIASFPSDLRAYQK